MNDTRKERSHTQCQREEKFYKKYFENWSEYCPHFQESIRQSRCKLKAIAKSQRLSYKLSFEKHYELISGECNFCGTKPCLGIFREDTDRGYTDRNSISSCGLCINMITSIGNMQ